MKKEKSIKAKSEAYITPNIKPLGDKVLIKEIEPAEGGKTESGIIIPDTVKEDRGAKKGIVISVGPGRFEDGSPRRIPMGVKAGDTVLYQWGDTVKIKDEEYVVVSESNIIGIIK